MQQRASGRGWVVLASFLFGACAAPPSGGAPDDAQPFSGIDGRASATGFATRYWNCCRPSCGSPAYAPTAVPSCNLTNAPLSDPSAADSCSGGSAYACWNLSPWAVSSTLAYGYAAASVGSCGSCYELQFTGASHNGSGDARSAALRGKRMVVKVVDATSDAASGQFDLLIPGGGVGVFGSCSTQWGTSDLGAQYGGFATACRGSASCVLTRCQAVFGGKPELLAGCQFYVSWMSAAENPSLVYTPVACPAALDERTQPPAAPTTPPTDPTTPPTPPATTPPPTSPPPITNGAPGFTTRYWDCCKPSCAWPANAPNGPARSCSVANAPLSEPGAASSCSGGSAYACWDLSPWAVSSTLAYGYAAASVGSCGSCYQLQFAGRSYTGASDPGSRLLAGKTMIVQVVSAASDSASGEFDLLIPGGGLGVFGSCSTQWGTTDLGAQYGGFATVCQGSPSCVLAKCQAVFGDKPELLAGCQFYVNWMSAADAPAMTYAPVACPAELTLRSGMQGP